MSSFIGRIVLECQSPEFRSLTGTEAFWCCQGCVVKRNPGTPTTPEGWWPDGRGKGPALPRSPPPLTSRIGAPQEATDATHGYRLGEHARGRVVQSAGRRMTAILTLESHGEPSQEVRLPPTPALRAPTFPQKATSTPSGLPPSLYSPRLRHCDIPPGIPGKSFLPLSLQPSAAAQAQHRESLRKTVPQPRLGGSVG